MNLQEANVLDRLAGREAQGSSSCCRPEGNIISTCPRCRAKLRENSYRRLKCIKCGFEGDRDTIAILNIGKRTLKKIQMGGALVSLTTPQMKDASPNTCREPVNPLRGALAL